MKNIQLPTAGTQITVSNINYIVLAATYLKDALHLHSKPYEAWHDNIRIVAKRPKGRRHYCIYQYASGNYSSPL